MNPDHASIKPLYPGDTTGPHPERLSGLPGNATNETEGIYTGYRYYDQEGAPVQYPFGYGLSYTNFGFSNLKLTPRFNGTIDRLYALANGAPADVKSTIQPRKSTAVSAAARL